MRRFTVLVGTLALAAIGVARFDSKQVQALAKQHHLSWKEAVSIDAMGRQFGVSGSELAKARTNHHLNNNDLANGLYLSRASSQDRNYIYKLRASGMGWGEIAHKTGVHPGTFNKSRKTWKNDSEVTDDIARYRLQRAYAMKADDVNWAQKRGMDWDDVVAANQLARDRNSRFRDVASRYSTSRNWDYVRSQGMRAGGAYDPRFDSPGRRPIITNPRRPIIFYGRSHETRLQRLVRERQMKQRFAKRPPETKLQKTIRERQDKLGRPTPTVRPVRGRPSPPPRVSKGNSSGPAKGLPPRKGKGKGG